MKELLILENISKKFGSKIVFQNINLSIMEGETLVIMGSNGCGKSTLLRIIAGISSFSNGKRVITDGRENLKISYVPDRFPKLPFNSIEYLYHMGRIQGLSKLYLDDRIEELFDVFNISIEMKKTLIKDLSKGTIQKIAVMQAILSKPDLLILDEPLSGLDEKSQDNFIKILEGFVSQGITMILTAHEKDFAQRIARRTIILENKELILDQNNNMENNKVHAIISFKVGENINDNIFKQINGVLNIKKDNDIFTIHADSNHSDVILTNILGLGASIRSVSFQKKS